MRQTGQHSGNKAKAGDSIGRHIAEPARQQRIGRPCHGRRHGTKIARHGLRVDGQAITRKNQHGDPCKAQQPADDRGQPHMLARQQARTDDDQQRPEIVDQSRLGRRGQLQGGKIQSVIAVKPAHTDKPDRPGLDQRPDGMRPHCPSGKANQTAHQKGHGRQLERWNFTRQRGQQCQRRPQANRPEACNSGKGFAGWRGDLMLSVRMRCHVLCFARCGGKNKSKKPFLPSFH